MDETPPTRPRPGPGHHNPPRWAPARPAPHPRRTRRWFLAGGLAVVVGGGAGVGAEYLRHTSPNPPPEPPAALLAAAAAERALIADLVATTGGSGDVRAVIAQATDDHRAHLAALEALLTRYHRPASASSSSAPAPGTPRTRAQLRSAETAAATNAAGHAAALSGAHAALLASIAACETGHAELFA
jgi:hypothetical protein